MGFDKTLRAMLNEMKGKEFRRQSVTSFMIQYYQHFPFELKGEIKPEKQLIFREGTHIQKHKETGVTLLEINPLAKQWFEGKYIFRLENRLFVKMGKKYLRQIDNLGMTKWHRNEYQYNTDNIPGESLYSHNVSDASRVIKDSVEVNGEYTEPAEVSTEAQNLMERKDTDLFDKLMDKPTDLYSLIEDMELDKTNPTALSVLSLIRPILRDMGVKIVYTTKDATKFGSYINNEIHINLNHPDFKGLTSGVPGEMKLGKFIETVAHEGVHAVTVKTIEDVMTGKETDPDKVQAVERIQALMDYSLKYIAKHPTMAASNPALIRLQNEMAKQSKAKKDTTKKAEIRFVQEFVSYVFTDEKFQQDMNQIKLTKNETWWQSFIKQLLRLLGLDISETEAQAEVVAIQKRLKNIEPYVTGTGEVSRRKTTLTNTLRDLEAYSALHVALREIISLTDIAKNEFISKQGAANIAAAVKEMKEGKKGKKLDMVDLYNGVSNFDPSWSEEMMTEYNKAVLNRNIIC
jgi:hypothetical protein